MKFLVTLFWSFAIWQVVAFIGAKLVGVSDNPSLFAVVSIIFALFIIVFKAIVIEKADSKESQ